MSGRRAVAPRGATRVDSACARTASAALAMLGTVLLGLLAACATPPVPPMVGNFAELAPEHEMTIVNDTVRQLRALYEPARHRLNLRQPTPDGFGVALIATLRANGYAMSEYAGPSDPSASPSPDALTRDQRADAGIDFQYILDRPEPDIVRITALIGGQSLSRAYTASRGRFLPFGAWARRE